MRVYFNERVTGVYHVVRHAKMNEVKSNKRDGRDRGGESVFSKSIDPADRGPLGVSD